MSLKCVIEISFIYMIKINMLDLVSRLLDLCRDMEQLSGGEKTMAALALLFSIHRLVLYEHFGYLYPSSYQ